MSRTLTASDRKRLIRLASSLPVGSPERKAILAGLSSMQGMLEEEGMMDKMSRKPWGSLGISPTDNQPWGSRDSQSKDYRELYNEAYYDAVTSKKARKALAKRVATLHRKGKNARVKLTDFEKVHIKAMLDHLNRVERLVARVTLNDASDALNDMEKVESAVDQFEGQGYTIHDDLYFWNDIPTDIEDSAFNMLQAAEEAIHDIKEMIDAGMADGGYEDAVMEKMENEVMPRIEDAIADHRHLLKSYR